MMFCSVCILGLASVAAYISYSLLKNGSDVGLYRSGLLDDSATSEFCSKANLFLISLSYICSYLVLVPMPKPTEVFAPPNTPPIAAWVFFSKVKSPLLN